MFVKRMAGAAALGAALLLGSGLLASPAQAGYVVTLEEVGDPAGNLLNHNLIQELLQTATLQPPDLWLLGDTE
jgi:hypothetical protein